MRHVLAVGFGLALWLGLSGPASAAFVLAVSNPGTLNPGQSALVTVSISWDGTPAGAANNFLFTEGLNAATIGLRLTTGPGTVTAVANPALGTDVIPAAGFNSVQNFAVGASGMPPGTGSNLLGAFIAAPGNGAVNAANGNAGTPITIGQLRITGGSAGLVTLTIERLDPSASSSSFGQFISGAGRVLDNPANGGVTGGTTTFAVVPEPTSMALVGMAATGFFGTMWRKRRKAQTVASAEETLLAV